MTTRIMVGLVALIASGGSVVGQNGVSTPPESLAVWRVESAQSVTGTAFLIDARGWFLTASHVIRGGATYKPSLHLSAPFDGELRVAVAAENVKVDGCEKIDTTSKRCDRGIDFAVLYLGESPAYIAAESPYSRFPTIDLDLSQNEDSFSGEAWGYPPTWTAATGQPQPMTAAYQKQAPLASWSQEPATDQLCQRRRTVDQFLGTSPGLGGMSGGVVLYAGTGLAPGLVIEAATERERYLAGGGPTYTKALHVGALRACLATTIAVPPQVTWLLERMVSQRISERRAKFELGGLSNLEFAALADGIFASGTDEQRARAELSEKFEIYRPALLERARKTDVSAFEQFFTDADLCVEMPSACTKTQANELLGAAVYESQQANAKLAAALAARAEPLLSDYIEADRFVSAFGPLAEQADTPSSSARRVDLADALSDLSVAVRLQGRGAEADALSAASFVVQPTARSGWELANYSTFLNDSSAASAYRSMLYPSPSPDSHTAYPTWVATTPATPEAHGYAMIGELPPEVWFTAHYGQEAPGALKELEDLRERAAAMLQQLSGSLPEEFRDMVLGQALHRF